MLAEGRQGWKQGDWPGALLVPLGEEGHGRGGVSPGMSQGPAKATALLGLIF